MSFAAFFGVLWRGKWLLIGVTAFAMAVGAFVILKAEPRYRAQAVLRTVSHDRLNSVTGMPSGISGLASLAGFNLSGDEDAGLALGTLKSRSFTADFIRERNLMPTLFPDRWDKARKDWIGPPPTITQAVDMFDRGGIRKVIEDRKTGFMIVQVEWKDPAVASEWLAGIIAGVNAKLREQKTLEASRSIEFLEKKLAETQAIEIRLAAYRLMAVQMKDMMISSTQDEYALKYVDKPLAQVAPQDRIWPRPMLILASAILMGGMASLVLVFFFFAPASPWVQWRAATRRSGPLT